MQDFKFPTWDASHDSQSLQVKVFKIWVFNVAVHEITKYFGVQLEYLPDRDVFALTYHLVNVTFKPPAVHNRQVSAWTMQLTLPHAKSSVKYKPDFSDIRAIAHHPGVDYFLITTHGVVF